MSGKVRKLFSEEQIASSLSHSNGNVTKAAGYLSAIKDVYVSRQSLRYWLRDMELPEDAAPKILVLDIETSPCKAWIWSLYQEVRSHKAIEKDWFIMTWAAKWLGNKNVMSGSVFQNKGYQAGDEDDSRIMADLSVLMNEADFIIAHNGDRFDFKKINTRLILNDLKPIAPYTSIDTLKMARRTFAFTSNALDFLAEKLCGYGKIPTTFQLWTDCMNGGEEAWKNMQKYNNMDVEILENVYYAIRPWDKGHPSLIPYTNLEYEVCTVCLSPDLSETGKRITTNLNAFTGLVCNSCGHHMRERKGIRSKEALANTPMNAR